MARLTGFLAAAAIVGSTATSVSAQTRGFRPVPFTPVAQQAHVSNLQAASCSLAASRVVQNRGLT